MNTIYKFKSVIICISMMLTFSSCDDFVQIDPPRTALVRSTVFASDATAKAAIVDIYHQMRMFGFSGGSAFSITFFCSLSSDEMVSQYLSGGSLNTIQFNQFNTNDLASNNSQVLRLWSDLYNCIYKSNAVIEGLEASSGLSIIIKQQLEGQAKFLRALCNFYLINVWGNVPLVTTTNANTNSNIPRTSVDEIYKQIISDLKDAQNLLPDDYSFSANDRVMANKSAATALLARTFLYIEDWENAETQATTIIDNPQYGLPTDLNTVFFKNSPEAILQLWNAPTNYPNEFTTFYIFERGPTYGYMRPDFATGFEPGDQRAIDWVLSTTIPSTGDFYYFPGKYKSFNPGAEYSTVLRLAEQYLIRAEARAQQGNIAGSQDDVNTIRTRANLSNTSANDKVSLLIAIEAERRSELFTEWGHRWFDLKRTNRVDAILSAVKPEWQTNDALFPIPESEMRNNLALKNAQNPGY